MSADAEAGAASARARETTHYSIIDKDGNAVAVTYTLNGSFGTGMVADGTGILLNNEMDDFTTKPGVPNLYGLVQGEANAIAPGKSPLSSMSPTIVSQGRQAVHGDRQPGRLAHHHHHAGGDHERHRPRHGPAGGDRRAAHPSPVAAGHGATWSPMRCRPTRCGCWPAWATTSASTRTGRSGAQAAGILVGGKSLAEIEAGGGARYNGAIDSRAASGEAIGY